MTDFDLDHWEALLEATPDLPARHRWRDVIGWLGLTLALVASMALGAVAVLVMVSCTPAARIHPGPDVDPASTRYVIQEPRP